MSSMAGGTKREHCAGKAPLHIVYSPHHGAAGRWDISLPIGGTIGMRIMLRIEDSAGTMAETWLGDPILLQVQAK